jgi:uncharacterized protein YcnI
LWLIFFGELRIARGKFSQVKLQAKENQIRKPVDSVFVNSQKQNQTSVNTTKELATELKTSEQTASRIIQIQAKGKNATALSAVAESFVSASKNI